MKIDTLIRLHNDLTVFTPEYPIAVQYDKQHGLKFRQLGRTIYIPYVRNYYFVKPRLRLGILTVDGYKTLMNNIQKLIEDSNIREQDFGMVIKPYAVEFYKCYPYSGINTPELFIRLEFVNIVRKWISEIYLMLSKDESKTLLKSIKHEERNKRKGPKLIEESATS